MRRYKNKNIKKFMFGLLIGNLVASMALYYSTAVSYSSSEVQYDNTESGLTATNVGSAINEIYGKEVTKFNELNTRVGSTALTTSASNISGAINELNSKKWVYSGTVGTSGGTITLPSSGTYLVMTGGYWETGTLKTLWIVRTGGNLAVCVGKDTSTVVSVSVSSTTITIQTTSGTTQTYYQKLY